MRTRFDIVATLLAAALISGCGPGAATRGPKPPPVEVRAAVDKAVATTGDRITYTVVVEHEPQIDVTLPEPGAEIAGLRILDSEGPTTEQLDGRIVERRLYRLRADLVGSYVLPEVSATYLPPTSPGGKPAGLVTVKTSRIFVEVKSVLPADGSATELRDIKPLERPRFGLRWVVWAGGALLLVAGAAAIFAVLRRRRRQPPAPTAPAHEVAFAALDALRATDFDDPAAVRRYYFALSEILRQYVEERFGLNATDLTSQEILTRAHELTGLGDQDRLLLRTFLLRTDEVKFAGHEPDEPQIRARYDEAVSFVKNTMPAPAPTQGAALQQKAA